MLSYAWKLKKVIHFPMTCTPAKPYHILLTCFLHPSSRAVTIGNILLLVEQLPMIILRDPTNPLIS